MVDQGAAERAHGGEALGDGSWRESGASARGLAVGVDELGRPVAVAVDVGAPGGERMGAAPVKPDEVQGEVGGASWRGSGGASCAGNRRRASRSACRARVHTEFRSTRSGAAPALVLGRTRIRPDTRACA